VSRVNLRWDGVGSTRCSHWSPSRTRGVQRGETDNPPNPQEKQGISTAPKAVMQDKMCPARQPNPNPCEAGGAVLAPNARPRSPVSRHPWLRTPAVSVAGQVLMWMMSGAGETSAHPGHPRLRTPAVNVAGQVLEWVMSGGGDIKKKHKPGSSGAEGVRAVGVERRSADRFREEVRMVE
jgi:hypothetical protein